MKEKLHSVTSDQGLITVVPPNPVLNDLFNFSYEKSNLPNSRLVS